MAKRRSRSSPNPDAVRKERVVAAGTTLLLLVDEILKARKQAIATEQEVALLADAMETWGKAVVEYYGEYGGPL